MTVTLWILAVLSGAAFVVSYVREPRRLRNGVLLLCTFLLVLAAAVSTGGAFGDFIATYVVTPLLFVAAVGYLGLILFLLVTGIIAVRREGRSLAMLLPIACAVLMLVLPPTVILSWVYADSRPGLALHVLVAAVGGVSAYAGFVFLSFAAFSLLYRLRTQHADAGVVVVLGSRIFDGRVPPLLAARIDRAIEVYRAHLAEGREPPLLICSGGQGPDEDRPEASAMAQYVRDAGIPAEHVVEEDQSRTTEQNLALSVRIARSLRGAVPMLVATNDFHTFRAALLTRRLGIQAQVIAAPTARYYRPAAYLREFIAVVRDYLWIHLGVLLAFTVFLAFLVWESLQMR